MQKWMKYSFIFLSVFTLSGAAYAQEVLASDEAPKSVSIKDTNYARVLLEPGIGFVLDLYEKSYVFKGYRIQIYAGPSKKDAKQQRANFLKFYSDIATHQTYDAPNFKIRVGDFENRLKALKFMNEIREHFPNCYLVPDELEVVNIKPGS